ncbi:MAG TPA: tetratricopeptide repeat protein [Amycolatopsis sp.]|nr:tetratricopeptide repeat protein [Amycolatopsis sp.]
MGNPLPGNGTTRVPQPRRPLTTAASGPQQLPHLPPNFTNRTDEVGLLQTLLDEAESGLPAVQLICGQAGVGKTALARIWSHRVAERFPAGHLWVDLGGFSPTGPLTPKEVLGRFVRALGVPPAGVPADVEELEALYRTVTADKPLLVLLDNAGTSEQVRPLLPGSPDSLVIVTSRRRMGTLMSEHRAQLVELSPLTAAHSTELLNRTLGEKRVGAEAPEAEKIAGLAGGLPVVLKIVTAKLAGNPKMSLTKVVTQLKQKPLAVRSEEGAASVDGVFDWSYDALPPDAAALYGALGLHPGPDFGAGAAAAAIGKSLEATEPLLEQLVNNNLLEQLDDDRYNFHDLIGLHAKEKTDSRDRETVRRRILEWYLQAASAAERKTTTADQSPIPYRFEHPPETPVSFETRDEALEWLELERANLIAAVELAYEYEMYELGWQLAAAMWPLFLLHKHYPDFLQVSQLGVKHARRWGNRSAEALMHNRSGAATRGTGRYDEAVGHYRAGHEAAKAGNDPVIAIRSVEGLGLVSLQQGRVDDALAAFTEDLRICTELDRQHDIGLARINLGATQTKAGRPAEALDTLRQARDLLDSEGDAYNVARARIELGRALGATGEPAAARAELTLAQETMLASGSEFEQARTLQALGEVAEAEGDLAQAKQLYDQALPIFVGLGRPEADALERHLRSL